MVAQKSFTWILALALGTTLIAGEKKPAQGHEEDESVAIAATVLPAEQVRQTFGKEISDDYTVVNVTVAPKGGKPYAVRFDDFILRSESSLNHSGPMSAGQIGGAGELVVQRTYGNRANVDSPRPIAGTKLEIKDDARANPALDELKEKILAEKSITAPESGLLFFPLSKENPKHLVLSCTTPAGKLRITFK